MKRIENKSFISKTLYCLSIAGCIALAAGCTDNSSHRAIDVVAPCTAGDTLCGADGVSVITCGNDGNWQDAVACPADKPVCDASQNVCVKSDHECEPNSAVCVDESNLKVCGDDYKYKAPEACPADRPKCSTDRCVPDDFECSAGWTACVDETHVKVCGDNQKWGAAESCPADKPKCYAGSGQCVDDSFVCALGERMCSDDFKGFSECGEDNQWGAIKPCPADKPVCDAGTSECTDHGSECEVDDFECTDSDKYRSCDAYGMWQNAICPVDKPVCSDSKKECIPEICVVGDFKCTDDHHFKTCLDNESWSNPEECPSDKPVCDETSKECLLPVPTNCTPDTDFCFGGNSESAAMYHCTPEGTKPSEPLYFCPDGCNDEGTACKPTKCTPKDIECTNDHKGVMTCKSDGTWDLDNILKCDGGFTCNSDTKECECTPGVPVCTHIGSKSEGLYHCTAKGEVGERIEWCKCTSDYKACSCENDGVNELGGERRKCRGTDSMVCEGGAWKVAKNCSRSEVCNDKVGGICIPAKTNGGVCKDDESICDANTVLTCQDGLYENLESGCGAKEFCAMSMNESGSVAKCVSSCASTTFCSPMGIVSCDSAGNTSVKPCAKSQKCVMKPVSSSPIPEQVTYKATCEMDVCAEGELSCGDESVLQVCRNNEWIKLVNCEADYHMPCISHEDIIGCYMSVLSAPLP